MTTFQDTGLNQDVLKVLAEIDFHTPTPIQAKCIPHLLDSTQDLVALAQTGTGKTAAFSLPIIDQVDADSKQVQAIIICPTRELCMQIAKDIYKFIKYRAGVGVTAVYGGASIETQLRSLRKDPQIVVGTPGRVQDFIKRRKLKIDAIKWLVLDEADEMLNMGFKEELDAILEETPETKQTLLFSATMPPAIRKIARNYMKDPLEISAGKKNVGSDNVSHEYYMVHAKDRYQALKRIADINPDVYGIIFCRTRRETQEVAEKLMKDHYSAEPLHGDLSQSQRDQVMKRFRNKQTQLLVATDVAARGIDVNDLTHVINYNLPDNAESYIHRSGRTGRAQKKGTSLAIVNMREHRKIREIERILGKSFLKAKIPSGQDICAKQLMSLIDKFETVEVDEKKIKPYLKAIYERFEEMDKEELIKRVVSIEFNRFLEFYKNAPDLNVNSESSRKERRDRKDNTNFSCFRINLGASHRLGPKSLIELIIKNPALKRVEIGRIEVSPKTALFEVDKNYEEDVLDTFRGKRIKGMRVKVEKLVGQTVGGGYKKRERGDFKSKGIRRGGQRSKRR